MLLTGGATVRDRHGRGVKFLSNTISGVFYEGFLGQGGTAFSKIPRSKPIKYFNTGTF